MGRQRVDAGEAPKPKSFSNLNQQTSEQLKTNHPEPPRNRNTPEHASEALGWDPEQTLGT